MLGDVNPDGGSDEPNPIFHRLAEALHISPTAFFDTTVCELSQTVELLRLWNGITDAQDRAKMLAMVRGISSHA